MRNITAYDNRAVQTQTRTDRIFRENSANVLHRLVEVDTNSITLASVTQLGRNKTARIIIHLLNPYTVLVDFALDITVSRAAYAQTNRTAGAVTRQANHAHIMSHILTTELCAETDLICLLQQLFLELDIAESTTGSVTRRWQTVVVMRRSEFNRQQVLLGTRTTNHNRDMIRRTSCCTEALHLLHKERNQRTRILNTCFRLLIQVCLIGTSATFRYAQETILITMRCLDIYLCRQIALRIHLVVHIQRSILTVTQIALRIGVIHTFAQRFFVANRMAISVSVTDRGPYALAFFAVNDSRTGILAERQLTFRSHFRVA